MKGKGCEAMLLHYVKADPSGNITLFVLENVPDADKAKVNAALLNLDKTAEQVGCYSQKGNDVYVAMMGGEFCGNASRSAAAYALQQSGKEKGTFTVHCSGCDEPLPARISKVSDTIFNASINLSLPLSVTAETITCNGETHEVTHVVLPGIDHYIFLTDSLDELDQKAWWKALQAHVREGKEPEAYGLIFYEAKSGRMVPAVYVTATGTLYWENSCGSGSAALAAALGIKNGKSFKTTLHEPGGPIDIMADVTGGKLQSIAIGGPVTLYPSCATDF
jgi:diaminopimelate epimerase